MSLAEMHFTTRAIAPIKFAVPKGSSTMLAPLDIFKMQDGAYVWKGAAENFEVAQTKVQQLATNAPGEYMIFSQTTGKKTLILDGPTNRHPQ